MEITTLAVTGFQVAISAFSALNAAGVMALAFRAGAYARQVDVNTGRLDTLERSGSPAVQRLEAKIDAVTDGLGRVEEMMVRHLERDSSKRD